MSFDHIIAAGELATNIIVAFTAVIMVKHATTRRQNQPRRFRIRRGN